AAPELLEPLAAMGGHALERGRIVGALDLGCGRGRLGRDLLLGGLLRGRLLLRGGLLRGSVAGRLRGGLDVLGPRGAIPVAELTGSLGVLVPAGSDVGTHARETNSTCRVSPAPGCRVRCRVGVGQLTHTIAGEQRVALADDAGLTALERARDHLLSLQHPSGWRKGELERNVTMD